MNVIQWRKDDVSFGSETGFFKTYESFMLLRAIIVIQKWAFRSVFPKFSSDNMTLCNNNDQTWFSDTLASVRPFVGR